MHAYVHAGVKSPLRVYLVVQRTQQLFIQGFLLSPQSFLRAPRPTPQLTSLSQKAESVFTGPPPRHPASASQAVGGRMGTSWPRSKPFLPGPASGSFKPELPLVVQTSHHRSWWQRASSGTALSVPNHRQGLCNPGTGSPSKRVLTFTREVPAVAG